MIIIRDPTLTSTIDDPGIRSLAETGFAQILSGETYDYDRHGYMIVVEPGDSIADLEAETCCTRSSDPIFEGLEENNCWYEKLTDTGPEPPYIGPVSAVSDSKQSNAEIFTEPEPFPNTATGDRTLASTSGKFPQNCPKIAHCHTPGTPDGDGPSPPETVPRRGSFHPLPRSFRPVATVQPASFREF